MGGIPHNEALVLSQDKLPASLDDNAEQ